VQIALLVCVSVLLSSAFSGVSISAPGKHCRTASVQKVQFFVAVNDAQGKLVLKPIDRAPKPGELAFKQCHCDDNSSSKEAKEASTNVAFVWFVPLVPTLIPTQPLERLVCESSLPSMVSLATHPPIPPPNEA
jgi:hypothetical protein